MKRLNKSLAALAVFAALALCSGSLFAAASASSGQTLGGPTGLIIVPTADVGWDNSRFGLDIGYHYVNDENGYTHIPKATFSLFGRGEIGVAGDFQDWDRPRGDKHENDFLVHGKFKFYGTNSIALAVGGGVQFIDSGSDRRDEATIGRVYLAATHAGSILGMPAKTTLTLGKSFGDSSNKDYKGYTRGGNIDFGVGFDIDFIPRYLRGYLHWLIDFANYSYSVDPMGADALTRGSINTGFRVLPLKNSSHLKWNIDIILNDALDHSRNYAIGTTFGVAF